MITLYQDSGHKHYDSGHKHTDAGHTHKDSGHKHSYTRDGYFKAELRAGAGGKRDYRDREKSYSSKTGYAKITESKADIQTSKANIKTAKTNISVNGILEGKKHSSETRPKNAIIEWIIRVC